MAKKMSDAESSPSPRKRRRRGNKSAAIRNYVAQHPEASTSEVVAALRAQRIKVTPQFVSTIKSKANGAAKSSSSAASKASASSSSSPYEQFKKAGELFSEALELVMKAGAKEAQDLVQMASKMVQRIRERP